MLASSLPTNKSYQQKLEDKRDYAVKVSIWLCSIVAVLVIIAIFLPYQNFSTTSESLSVFQTVRVNASGPTELTFDSVGSNFTVFMVSSDSDLTLLTGEIVGSLVDYEDQPYAKTVFVPEGTHYFGVQNANVNITFGSETEVLKWYSRGDVYLAAISLLGILGFIIVMEVKSHYSKDIRD